MIEKHGEVISQQGNLVKVIVETRSTCQACEANSICGTAVIGRYFANKHKVLLIENTCSAQTGDSVILMLPEKGLLVSALGIYILPLVLMFFFALVTASQLDNELASVLGGLFGLLAGFFMVACMVRRWETLSLFKASIRPAHTEFKTVPVVTRKVSL